MPIVSAIVPVYNVERYLAQCLDSLVQQTLQDLEIIIVNDATKDDSEKIILSYAAKEPRIKYYKHETNRGLGGARNTGLQHASGEWVTFVDSDDWLSRDCLEHAVNQADEARADCVMFGIARCNSSGNLLPDKKGLRVLSSNNVRQLASGRATTQGNIYRRIDLGSIQFPENLRHEDEAFWLKYLMSVKPSVVGDPDKHYYYRTRPGSIMSDTASSRIDLVYIIQDIYHFMNERGLLDQYGDLFLARSNRFCYAAMRSIDKDALTTFSELLRDFYLNCSLRNQSITRYLFLSICLLQEESSRSFYREEALKLDSRRINASSTYERMCVSIHRWYLRFKLFRCRRLAG